MFPTYTQKQSPAQKKDAPTAASVHDNSSQSESLQRKADMANNAAQHEEASRPNNTGMPDNLKSGIESLSGFSMDDVRVHYNSSKPATVQALAYTQGTDIHVAPGQEKHLPHEAWHVAQQMAGRVSPTTNINGMPVNDNAALEHEADVMGGKAMQMKADESKTAQRATIWNGVVQRDVDLKEYYYHISKTGIPADKEINPMIAIEKGKRSTIRGDDLGPGFYMGDSTFLKYYYDKNFQGDDAYIYYIEKNLIDVTMKNEIEDFTQETAPKTTQETGSDNWFQIAMQLGFLYANENGYNKSLRPLDILAYGAMTRFTNFVEKKYGNDAEKIIKFFENAIRKAIWKGYINDIDNGELIITLEEEKIVDFLSKFIPKDVGVVKKNVLIHELRRIVPKELKLVGKNNDDAINNFFKNESGTIREKIDDINNTFSTTISKSTFISKYRNLLKGHTSGVKNIYIGKNSEVRPMQIAIRKEVEYTEGGTKKSLLKKIKDNMISITKTEIDTTMETEGTKSEKDKLKKKLKEFLAGTSTPPIPQNSSV